MSDLVSQKVNMIFKSLKGETVHALKDITFTLKKGELLTVLGPSGCGKTTLLNIAAGFLRPTSGSITLGNNEINGPGLKEGWFFNKVLCWMVNCKWKCKFWFTDEKEDPGNSKKSWRVALYSGLKGFGNLLPINYLVVCNKE